MKSAFNKFPSVEVKNRNHVCTVGWQAICQQISKQIKNSNKTIIVIETYHGVDDEEIINSMLHWLKIDLLIETKEYMKKESEIKKLTYPDVTDDQIFGFMTKLNLGQFFDSTKLRNLHQQVLELNSGLIIIYGCGASLIQKEYDLLIYTDMARWEIQKRFRKNLISNLGINNLMDSFSTQYKRAYFVDWRLCDKHKKNVFRKVDYFLDTNIKGNPKMISKDAFWDGLKDTVSRPFSLVPFFDPGPWGGQWMKNVCDLDSNEDNFAWCFNCVPEENSLLLKFHETLFEMPAINVVFFEPTKLLGEQVQSRFGDEFPIRFDFLDTMDGGNLSLQVHPITKYIKDNFGLNYTQDESYYILDAKEEAKVYLGLKSNINSQDMITDLTNSQINNTGFNADNYVQTWDAKKHDHFLIPAGTIHCSGANCMVLEVSAPPYIFTFKLWDWDRLGLDGKPRPINIERGEKVIQWERDTKWVKNELINKFVIIDEGDGWLEERTGLHGLEFIETRRHWFTKKIFHSTNGTVNVLTLVEGEEIVIESPSNAFEPFTVHYAETFVVPADVMDYSIRPTTPQQCATIKAYVRN